MKAARHLVLAALVCCYGACDGENRAGQGQGGASGSSGAGTDAGTGGNAAGGGSKSTGGGTAGKSSGDSGADNDGGDASGGTTAGSGGEGATSGGTSGGSGGEGGASGGEGGDGTGASGGLAGSGGGESCGADGSACAILARAGLCKGGTCSPCTDVSDDSACALAYGAGNLCAGSFCQVGCHDSSTCAGEICDPATFTCRPCAQSPECPVATPHCDVESGTCGIAPPPCADNTACNGGSGWCCAGTCYAGADDGCCGDVDCGDEVCNLTAHICMPSGCTQVPDPNRFYVNRTPPNPALFGAGTVQCPFKSLDNALANVPENLSSTFTICTQGTFAGTAAGTWPRIIPKYVVLDGTYCDFPNITTHSVLEVPADSTGVQFGEGPAGMHGYDVIYQGGSLTTTGILATAGVGTITLRDLTINEFGIGINASTGAQMLIQRSVDSMLNNIGLSVYGALVDIDVTDASTSRSRFNQNGTAGITVNSAGTLRIKGLPYTGPGSDAFSRTVAISNNEQLGIAINDADENASVTLDHVRVANNGYTGIYVQGPARVRNSVITGHEGGVHVDHPNYAAVDFGTEANGPGAGNNHIFGNTTVGLYLFAESDGPPMQARGNIFSSDSSKDCRTTTATLSRRAGSMAGDVGVSSPEVPFPDVNNCK